MGQHASSSSDTPEQESVPREGDLSRRVLKIIDNVASPNEPEYRIDLTNLAADSCGFSVAQALQFAIENYANLQSVGIRFNRLTEAPQISKFLPRLRRLSLENNSIQVLRLNWENLSNLEELNIGSNPLQALPTEIGSYFSFAPIVAWRLFLIISALL